MSLFAISDLHLSLSCDKKMDIFSGWENYVEKLSINWKKLVNDNDTVVLPGDISWEMRISSAVADFGFIDKLPGKKIIIKGNHDLWWESMTKMQRFLNDNSFNTINILHNNYFAYNDYAVCGSRGWFVEENGDKKLINREAGRVKASIKAAIADGYKPIVFLHYPPRTSSIVCEEIIDVLNEYEIKQCYYGHLHRAGASTAINGEIEGIYYKCVSCDMLGFTPLMIIKE